MKTSVVTFAAIKKCGMKPHEKCTAPVAKHISIPIKECEKRACIFTKK